MILEVDCGQVEKISQALVFKKKTLKPRSKEFACVEYENVGKRDLSDK